MGSRHDCEVGGPGGDTRNAIIELCQNDQIMGQNDQSKKDDNDNDNSSDYVNDYYDTDQGTSYKELVKCQRLAIENLFRNWLQEKFIDLKTT